MTPKAKMICSDCGVEMNHHATKVDNSVASSSIDPAFEGVVEEAHTCPECGCVAVRPA